MSYSENLKFAEKSRKKNNKRMGRRKLLWLPTARHSKNGIL